MIEEPTSTVVGFVTTHCVTTHRLSPNGAIRRVVVFDRLVLQYKLAYVGEVLYSDFLFCTCNASREPQGMTNGMLCAYMPNRNNARPTLALGTRRVLKYNDSYTLLRYYYYY